MIPKELWQTAINVQAFLQSLNVPFCFIGGIAIQRWGEPRVTKDVDATIIVEFGDERPLIQAILENFDSRIESPEQFAIQSRVLLVADGTGNGIDISLGSMLYEQSMAQRASDWGVPVTGKITTCSAEDLVILKSFASRPQDWIDVEKVIIRQGAKLNRDLIVTELQPLVDLKEEPEIMEHLLDLLGKHS